MATCLWQWWLWGVQMSSVEVISQTLMRGVSGSALSLTYGRSGAGGRG